MATINKNLMGMVLMLALFSFSSTNAQEVDNDFQARSEIKLSFKPFEKIQFNLTPMLRFNDNFDFDQYIIEGELVYKAFKDISFGGAYRFIGNQNKYDIFENSSRYAFFAEAEKKINSFKPSIKLSYTDYADDDSEGQFLRYKAGLSYNIPNCKITPEIDVEAFHDLSNSNFNKIRYSVGLNYKLFKNNSIGLDYKLDYYLQEARNKHIINLGYKIKF